MKRPMKRVEQVGKIASVRVLRPLVSDPKAESVAKGPSKERIDGRCLGQTLNVNVAVVSSNVGPFFRFVSTHEVVSAWAFDQKGEQGASAD